MDPCPDNETWELCSVREPSISRPVAWTPPSPPSDTKGRPERTRSAHVTTRAPTVKSGHVLGGDDGPARRPPGTLWLHDTRRMLSCP
jgi:hypothetical protein